MADWTFWLTCLLTTVSLMLPVVAWRFYKAGTPAGRNEARFGPLP